MNTEDAMLRGQAKMWDAFYDWLSKPVARATPKIVTENVYPPIPMRQFDWCAYRDGYEPPDGNGAGGGLVGWGRTEADAIADLKEREEGAA